MSVPDEHHQQHYMTLWNMPGLAEIQTEISRISNIRVAVLDGTVDYSHPCFIGARLRHLNTGFVTHSTQNSISTRHGTHIASILFGQPDSPVRGLIPQCEGIILPIFNETPDGALIACSQVDLARAVTRAVEEGAHIINISGGQLTHSGEADEFLNKAVNYCLEKRVLIVAAVGNDACQCLHVPAALPAVLAAGAMDSQGLPLDSGNWGETYQTHGLLAPGEKIPGALPGGGTTVMSGSSAATAVISGVAALLLDLQEQYGITPNPYQVRDALLNSAFPCNPAAVSDCRRVLVGSINIPGARALLTGTGEIQVSDEVLQSPPEETAEAVVETGAVPAGKMMPVTTPVVPAADEPAQVMPSACSDGTPPQLVYALGTLGYDFGSPARRDSIFQHGSPLFEGNVWTPENPRQLLQYLTEYPEEAESVTWVLRQEETPVYAVRPAGSFSAKGFERLREFLLSQLDEGVERISVPGFIAGNTRLLSGQTLPAIVPVLRGMYSWSTSALIHVMAEGEAQSNNDEKAEGVRNFLDRVYYELRNLGVTPQERAINYAATNAFQLKAVFAQAVKDKMELDIIEVEKSPLCREHSECFDVKLRFFDPEQRHQRARKIHRFTVDVSDVVPVTVGRIRSWSVY